MQSEMRVERSRVERPGVVRVYDTPYTCWPLAGCMCPCMRTTAVMALYASSVLAPGRLVYVRVILPAQSAALWPACRFAEHKHVCVVCSN